MRRRLCARNKCSRSVERAGASTKSESLIVTGHAVDIAVFMSHLTALVGVLASAIWPMRRDLSAAICALFLLIWTDLVCTGLILSCFGQLGDRAAYVAVSLGLAIAFRMAARLFISLPPVVKG